MRVKAFAASDCASYAGGGGSFSVVTDGPGWVKPRVRSAFPRQGQEPWLIHRHHAHIVELKKILWRRSLAV